MLLNDYWNYFIIKYKWKQKGKKGFKFLMYLFKFCKIKCNSSASTTEKTSNMIIYFFVWDFMSAYIHTL